jgi:hypothetical protein
MQQRPFPCMTSAPKAFSVRSRPRRAVRPNAAPDMSALADSKTIRSVVFHERVCRSLTWLEEVLRLGGSLVVADRIYAASNAVVDLKNMSVNNRIAFQKVVEFLPGRYLCPRGTCCSQ